jgi:hypothetical protein
MTTLTITLPADLARIAQEKGLLSPVAIEAYLRGQISENNEKGKYPPGFDIRLRGAAAPELMGTVQYQGDIVAPLDIKWEAIP